MGVMMMMMGWEQPIPVGFARWIFQMDDPSFIPSPQYWFFVGLNNEYRALQLGLDIATRQQTSGGTFTFVAYLQ